MPATNAADVAGRRSVERGKQPVLWPGPTRLRKFSVPMQGFGKQRELIRVQCKMQTPIIDRTRHAQAGRRKPAAGSSNTTNFAEHLRTELPAPAEQRPELAPTASLSTILGAQEAEADENERRGAARYGADLLDRLAELRLNLLSGTLPAARLHALARALRDDRRPSGDPRIEIVVEEIELRVQVEIAKLANSYQPRRPTGIEASG